MEENMNFLEIFLRKNIFTIIFIVFLISLFMFSENNIAAAAVAVHECGHAVQHAKAYAPLKMRSALVPVVNIASKWMSWVLLAGIIMVESFPIVLEVGIALFGITTLFAFITLPVEIDASKRALLWLNESGISAGFFDSSNDKEINFSEFHLPPLAILFENAKSTPQIMTLEKARQIAEAEVAKQKRHIFSYVTGHASYSYGKADMWGNNNSSTAPMIYQFQGTEQSYWNVGVNVAVPLEDILDLSASVKRKKYEVEQAVIAKDVAYDNLKLQIATLFVRITNNLVTLKTIGESAAAYQGAGALNKEDFENGNMNIEDYAYTTLHESGMVQSYQDMQTTITTDIITLEILSHTPIITNSSTEITLDKTVSKTEKELAKENKAVEKRIKKAVVEEEKKTKALEKAEKKAEKAAAKAAKNKK